MNTINQSDISTIYEHTAAILAVGSLIMGITLLTLRSALKNSGIRSKSGLKYLAMAMFLIGIINLLEYAEGVDIHKERYSLSLVVVASSIELFLIFTAYMSMLCKEFATRRRIFVEIGCIVLFATPVLFVSPDNHPLLFEVLFVIALLFYCVKLACNYFEYRKQIKSTRNQLENFLSNDSSLWLKWITNTFCVVLTIGIISVIAPMTNLTVLVFYNLFLFLAFFYIYISVIRNIYLFDRSMEMLESDERGNEEVEALDVCASQTDMCPKPAADFMASRQKVFDDWIAARGYAVAGITATEVATQLETNRTKLSHYLRDELNTTYYEWIAGLRIEDAKRQLIDHPNRAIYEIASNVGIEDRDNFRRVFQKNVGVSPTSYRKQGGA